MYGFRVPDLGFMIQDLQYCSGLRDLGFGISGSGFRVQDLRKGLGLNSLGVSIQGLRASV